jgi:6-phosphogluconolactonase
MRSFLTTLVFLGLAMNLRADTFVYVSMAPEQKIQVYRLEPKDGKLTAVETVAVEGAPGALAVDPKQKYLFASLRSNNTLASFRIDPASGKLKPLSTAPPPKGENASFVRTDRTGRWLLSASYAAGKVVVHRVKDDGTIETPAVQTVETAKTAHCVAIDRDNRFVLVPHVAANAVYQFRLDAATGKLKEAGQAKGGADKAGPRHLAFHPTQKLAFTSNEQGNSITAYRFDPDKGLAPVQTLSTLPDDFKGTNSTAEVKVHPNGKFVWVSNRGYDSLAGFAIDGKTGNLTALGQTPTEKTPRSFEIDPDGRFLFGAGEGSGKLAVFQVDAGKGKLTRLHTYDVGKSLTWVLAVKFTEPAEAGPDFRIQGEYEGEVTGKGKHGAQVVAQGDGKFDVYLLTGGLPGAGWDGKGRQKLGAKTESGKTTLAAAGWSGVVADGKLTGKTADGDEFSLKRIDRKSSTLGAKPPEGAIVLFDGKNADQWKDGKVVENNLLNCGTTSKKGFAAGKLHIEFRTPFMPKARGQGRGNSGVFVQGFEVQVLDSFGLEGKKDECGAFYGKAAPSVNMCLPPLAWQTYDVEIKADDKNNTVATVYHNGVKVYENFVLRNSPPKPITIHLQNHGNPVVYRNVWFVESK